MKGTPLLYPWPQIYQPEPKEQDLLDHFNMSNVFDRIVGFMHGSQYAGSMICLDKEEKLVAVATNFPEKQILINEFLWEIEHTELYGNHGNRYWTDLEGILKGQPHYNHKDVGIQIQFNNNKIILTPLGLSWAGAYKVNKMVVFCSVKSRTANKWYNVACSDAYLSHLSVNWLNPDKLSCSCPSWTRNMPRKDCVHLSLLKNTVLTGKTIPDNKDIKASTNTKLISEWRYAYLQHINKQQTTIAQEIKQPAVDLSKQIKKAENALCDHKVINPNCETCMEKGDAHQIRFALLELD